VAFITGVKVRNDRDGHAGRESASKKELNAVEPPADAQIPTTVRPWVRSVGSARFFAFRLLSFLVVLDVGG